MSTYTYFSAFCLMFISYSLCSCAWYFYGIMNNFQNEVNEVYFFVCLDGSAGCGINTLSWILVRPHNDLQQPQECTCNKSLSSHWSVPMTTSTYHKAGIIHGLG